MNDRTEMDERPNEDGKRKPTHKRDVFHAWMLEGLDFSRPWDMPKLKAVDARPMGCPTAKRFFVKTTNARD